MVSDTLCDTITKSANWRRPAGPINVWKIVDGYEHLPCGTKKPVKISIQEIPENKYDEVIKHYCEHYVEDEPYCKFLDLKKNHPEAIEDYRIIWTYTLKQGMAVGAFKLDSDGKIGKLIGCNLLIVSTDEVNAEIRDIISRFKSPISTNVCTSALEYAQLPDLRGKYNVDKFIMAKGLYVSKAYRGQKIGYHLLKAREDIGKKYGIVATANCFSSPSAQAQARRAGFEVYMSEKFADLIDDKSRVPEMESEELSVMTKKLI